MRAYVINLGCHIDRLVAVGAEFARFDLPFTRIEGLNPTLIAASWVEGYFDTTGPFGRISHKDQCRLFSHLRAWRVLLESGEEFAAIFEDDAALLDRADLFLTTKGWLPKDALAIQLEEVSGNRRVLVGRPRLPVLDRVVAPLVSSQPSLRAYVISRAAVEPWFCENAPRYRMPLERYLFDPAWTSGRRAKRTWRLVPGIAFVNQALSNERAELANSSCGPSWKTVPYRTAQAVRELSLRATGRAAPVSSLL